MASINSAATFAREAARTARKRNARTIGKMLLAGSALGCTLLPVGGAAAQQIREISPDGAPIVIDSSSITVPNGGGMGIEAETTGEITINSGSVETESALGHAIVARGGEAAVTIGSGSVLTSGVGAHGIDVNTAGGSASITSGDVQTSGSGQVFGISAVTNGGNIAIDSGTIAVASAGTDNGRGINANSGGGDITINAGTTVGHSRAIFTTTLFSGPELGFTAGNTRITSESATATGGNAIIGQGYSVDITSGRAVGIANPAFTAATIYVSAGEGGAIVRAGETLGHGFGQYGIQVLSSGGLVIESESVVTDGVFGNGITAFGSAAITIDSESVATTGSDSLGIMVDGYTAYAAEPVKVTSGTVTTAGAYSNGIFVRSFDATAGMTGDITIDSGMIEAAGVQSHGIVVASSADPGYQYRPVSATAGTGALTVVSDSIVATGPGGRGIVFDHAGAITLASGSIEASAGGIYMWAGSTADITSGSVTTQAGPGIVVYGAAGKVTLDAGDTDVGADGDAGIYVETTSGDIAISAARTATNGIQPASGFTADGISAVSTGGGDIAIDSGIVSVKGEVAFGIYSSTAGSIGIVSDQVSTTGSEGFGIWAGGSEGVTIDSGSIATLGANATAIRARSLGGDVAISSGSIRTSGEGAAGIFVPTSVGGGSVMVGDIMIDSGSIETGGANAYGIVVADATSPTFGMRPAQGGTGALSITSGSIVTSGSNSWGIAVDHRGPISIASGSITTGEGAGHGAGIYVWGEDAIEITSDTVTTPNGAGIVVYGGAGDVTLTTGTTTVGAGGDVGVWARTTTGNISINAGTTTTARQDIRDGMFTADGVSGLSANGGDVSITADVTSVAGLSAWGVTAYTSGAASITSNKVTTSGDDGIGIFGRGDTGGVRIASGDVATTGLRAHGIQAVSTTGDIVVDSTGSISVVGGPASGIHARSTSGNIAVSVKDIEVRGNGIGIDLAATSGGDITLAVNGNVSLYGGGQFAAALLGGGGDKQVTVGADGSLFGTGSGIVSQGGTLVLDNHGTIRGNGARPLPNAVPEAGVRLQSAGVINNSGTIVGRDFGIVTTQVMVPNPAGGFSPLWLSVDTEITNSGTIAGENEDAIALFGGGTIRNSGTIAGYAGALTDGIQLQWYPGVDSGREQIGAIVNGEGGWISGARYGIILAGGGTIENAGEIEGGAAGVVLVNQNFAGKTGALSNSGTIGSQDGLGVLLNLDSASVVNTGTIEAGAIGIDVQGGQFSLENGGTIAAAGHAVRIAGAAQIDNSGSIVSNGGVGLIAAQGGNVRNTGTIFGAEAAFAAGGSTVLDNAGTLASNSGVAAVLSGFDDHLILRAGSAIQGVVDGGDGVDTVSLIGSSAQPSVGQVVGRLDQFETLSVESGYWSTGGYVGEFGTVRIGADGALQVNEVAGTDGESPIGTLDVRNNGLLVFNFANDVGIDAETPLAISGSGAVALVGSGTVLVETDTLTHNGGTVVANGALVLTGSLAGDVTTTGNGVFVLGDGGTDGTFTGNLVNDGTFIYARLDDYDFTGDFSGAGALEKHGDGTLTFSGAYNFAGTTTILGGSVKFTGQIDPSTEFDLANGSLDLSGSDQTIGSLSGGGQSSVDIDGSQLTIDQDEDTVFAGEIKGEGGLTLTGGGQLNLTGNSSYTGVTIVEDGTLKVNGAIVSSVVLAAGGTLGGNGTVGSTTVSGGSIGPGNSIGRLAVAGNLNFGAGSVYEVEANAAGAADRIDVTGTTTIANSATVQVLAENGTYNPRTEYTILTSANGITGSFGSVSSNLAFLTPRLRYTSNEITLTLYRNDIRFAAVAATRNQVAVANAVESLGIDNGLFEEVLVQSANAARDAYDSLSGEIHATTATALINDARLVRDVLVESMPAEGLTGAFPIASLMGNWGKVNARAGAAGADLDHKGLVAGAGLARNGFAFGFAGLISKSDQNVDARSSRATAESWGLAGFAGYSGAGLTAQAGASFAWHRVHANRSAVAGEIADSLKGQYDASTRQVFGNISYDLDSGELDLAPFVRLANVRYRADAFAETGGATALAVAETVQESTFLTLGADARLPLGKAVRARLSGGWQHGWGDLSAVTSNRFAGSDAFQVSGIQLPEDAAVVDAGLDAEIGPMWIGASYLGSYGAGWKDHGVRLTATLRF